jgi:hypothetical protein
MSGFVVVADDRDDSVVSLGRPVLPTNRETCQIVRYPAAPNSWSIRALDLPLDRNPS